jgi:transcriptional regulator with XRE-family HTH domain
VEGASLAELVRELRETRGLGLNQLALKAKVDKGWLSRVENGQVKRPHRDKLVRISRALNVPVDELELATGRLSAEERVARSERPSTVDVIQSDPRLTEANRRLLVEMYRALVGGTDGR